MTTQERNIVGWFEIPVNNMKRAKKFYAEVFNIGFEKIPMKNEEMYAFPMHHEAPQATGCLVKGDYYSPSPDGVVIYFSCKDLDEELLRVEQAGGRIVLKRTNIGEHGFIAWVIDSEGNKIALHSQA